MPRFARRTGLALVVGSLLVTVAGSGEASASVPTTTPANAAPAQHGPGSRFVPGTSLTPHPLSAQGTVTLSALAGTADDDVWAVGTEYQLSSHSTATMHWDGTRWSKVPSNPGSLYNPGLFDVAAVSRNDVWAVGQSSTSGGNGTVNLAMHWDGTEWSPVPTPDPAGQYRYLGRVSVISPHEVFASGTVCESGEGPCALQVLRWNGHVWSVVDQPPVSQLYAMSGTGYHDGFGIGQDSNGTAISARLNGPEWRLTRLPSTQYGERLVDVSDAGTGAVWAVGSVLNSAHQPAGEYAVRWVHGRWHRVDSAGSATSLTSVSARRDGSAWFVGGADLERWSGSTLEGVDYPIARKEQAQLQSVVATGDGHAWLLGTYSTIEGTRTVLMHYDGSQWRVTRTIGGGRDQYLAGVDASSAADAWEVGGTQTTLYDGDATTRHWNGTSWEPVTPAHIRARYSSFSDVDTLSTDDAWAVGDSSVEKYMYDNLIERWDGTSWRVVPSPNLDLDQNYLSAVSADGPDDAWAVGMANTMYGQDETAVALRWDGSAWQRTALPDDIYLLEDVAARTPSDVWAVGRQLIDKRHSGAVALHWDGGAWSVSLSLPGDDDHGFALRSVVAEASDDVWAVGGASTYHHAGGKPETPLALHWDGSSWNQVETPQVHQPQSYFADVSSDGVGGLWAVGYLYDHYYEEGSPLVERWDGTTWTRTKVADLPPGSRLSSVAGGDADLAWAVGVNDDKGLTLTWDGTAWHQ